MKQDEETIPDATRNATREAALELTALQEQVARHPHWYHSIALAHGVTTPGQNLAAVWDNIRVARRRLEYAGTRVLDVGSMEGLWAFEAEDLGATEVIATDCYGTQGFGNVLEKFLLCRSARNSRVLPYYNVSAYSLRARLDVLFEEPTRQAQGFDIVQHLGVLYHLRDPLRGLAEARHVVRPGGWLLLETVIARGTDSPFLLFNGSDHGPLRIYDDSSTWWAPSRSCLEEMLASSCFEPLADSWSLTAEYETHGHSFARAALVCRAVSDESLSPRRAREWRRRYRNE